MDSPTFRWTRWPPLAVAYRDAPSVSGVYEVRDGDGVVRYVGEGGHRRGKGVVGRLRAYAVGKTPDAGLPAHSTRLALSDPLFCRRIGDAARTGAPWTIRRIAVEAAVHLGLEARSAPAADHKAAEAFLKRLHGPENLWNIS